MGLRGELFSSRAVSEKRMYFFNVKENRRGDMFLNIVESKRTTEGASETDRHQIVVYQEELEDFYNALSEAVDHIKNRKWQAFRDKRKGGRSPHADSSPAIPRDASGRDSVPPKKSDSAPPGQSDSASPQDDSDTSSDHMAAAPEPPKKKKVIRTVRLRRGTRVDELEKDRDGE
ncbi:MAG: DUF3276 family protein [Spirochaeta sp.]